MENIAAHHVKARATQSKSIAIVATISVAATFRQDLQDDQNLQD
jgi:hypothetical protein